MMFYGCIWLGQFPFLMILRKRTINKPDPCQVVILSYHGQQTSLSPYSTRKHVRIGYTTQKKRHKKDEIYMLNAN